MKPSVIVAVVGLFALSGCTSPRPEGTWVSRIGDTDAVVAVSIQDAHAVAFMCGGDNTLNTHTRWMYSAVDEDDEVVSFLMDGWQLDMEIAEPGAQGEITSSSGEVTSFGAMLTPGTDTQGVYSSVNDGCRDGLIVMDNGGGPVAQGVWCDDRGLVRRATPIEPIAEATVASASEGIEMVASTVSKRHEFVVTPLVASELVP